MPSCAPPRPLRLATFSTLVAAALLAVSLPAGGDERPATPTAGSFSATADVQVVEIPVQVVRHGEPVRGLTAADFQVWAGNKPQQIVGFDVVDAARVTSAAASATPASVASVPVSGRRHFLFLFDLSYSDPRSLDRAQQASLQIARDSLQPADLAAVGVYSPVRGARLVLSFTSDRQQLELALSTLGSTELVERRPDYLGLLLGQAADKLGIENGHEHTALTHLAGDSEVDLPNPGQALAEKVLNDMRLLDSMHQRDMAAEERDRVRRFTTSLKDLAMLMEQVQGRKHVVFLSRGFDASLLTGQQQVEGREIVSADEEMREIVRTDSDARWGNSRLQRALRESLDEMRRADCVIHAIDISGAEVQVRGISGEAGDIAKQTASSGHGSESLFVMAQETGGTFYQNFNDVGAALKQVLESTSITYVLTIQPEGIEPKKGGYVPLRVEVRGASRGEVSARPGYFVGTPPGAQQALRERLKLADLVMDGRPAGQVEGAVMGVPLAGPQGGACAIVQVDGTSFLTGHVGDMASAEVTVYAFDAAGAIRASARQLVGMDLRQVGAKLRTTGFKLFAALDLPPGHYDLRALVRNTVSDRFGIAVGGARHPGRRGGLGGDRRLRRAPRPGMDPACARTPPTIRSPTPSRSASEWWSRRQRRPCTPGRRRRSGSRRRQERVASMWWCGAPMARSPATRCCSSASAARPAPASDCWRAFRRPGSPPAATRSRCVSLAAAASRRRRCPSPSPSSRALRPARTAPAGRPGSDARRRAASLAVGDPDVLHLRGRDAGTRAPRACSASYQSRAGPS